MFRNRSRRARIPSVDGTGWARAVFLLALAAPVLLIPALAAATSSDKSDQQEASIIERTFKSADKNSDRQLVDDEVNDARRILRGALLGSLPKDIPGGKATRDKIEDLTTKQIKGSKDGIITLEEFTKFAESLFDSKDTILKAAAKREADELAKQKEREEEMRRKAREQAAKQRQHHHKHHKHN